MNRVDGRVMFPPLREPPGDDLFQIAVAEAVRLNHDYLGVEHVLMALSRCDNGYTQRMLDRLHLEPGDLRAILRARAGPNSPEAFTGRVSITPRLHQVLDRLAPPPATPGTPAREAVAQPGERELLLAILESGPGLAARTLAEAAVELAADNEDADDDAADDEDHGDQGALTPADAALAQILAAIRADSGPETTGFTAGMARRGGIRGNQLGDDPAERLDRAEQRGADGEHAPQRRAPTPFLDRIGRDLTALARQGRLRPMIERKRYYAEIAQALAREDKNTPVLVGEAGVGKTAIVEGLAQRLAQEAERPVVAPLRGKRIIEVRVADLVAGASARGEFEEQARALLRECAAHPEIILFIDEIHTLVGAGHSAGNQDAAQFFKTALERGELRLIGATTDDEYSRYFARDAALDRRFQRIPVAEPSPTEAEEMLRDLTPIIEARTGVRLEPEALVSAIELSVRYIHNERLPGKAIGLLYDACARVAVPSTGISMLGADMPLDGGGVVTPALVEEAVSQRVGFPIGQTEARLRERLQDLEDKLRQRVVAQEAALAAVAQTVRVGYALVRDPTRPKAVLLFTGPSGVGKTETARALAETLFSDAAPQQLLILDMAEFSEKHMLAQLIGSPPGYVDSDQEGRLTRWLKLHPFGIVLFDEVEKAHENVRRALLGLFEQGRLTDAQGRTINGREAIYIMTSNLLADTTSPAEGVSGGAPVGAGAGPGAIPEFLAPANPSLDQTPALEELTRQQLVSRLSPEFVGRIDRIIVYQPLSRKAIHEIVLQKLDRIRHRLDPQGVKVDASPGFLEWLAQHGVSPTTGARHLDGVIQHAIQEPLADLEFRGKLTPGVHVQLTLNAEGEPDVRV